MYIGETAYIPQGKLQAEKREKFNWSYEKMSKTEFKIGKMWK